MSDKNITELVNAKVDLNRLYQLLKEQREYEKKYKDISLQIAKPVIQKINETFGTNFDIKILVGESEAKRELGNNFPYHPEAATPILKDNIVYIIVGEEYYHNALNTTEKVEGSPEDIPLPLVTVHEFSHGVLEKVLPKTQEKRLGLEKLLDEAVPLWEFWTELFANLFWRSVYGEKIPEHRYTVLDLPTFYINDIKEILREQSKIPKLEERLRRLEEVKKIFEQGYRYVIERNGKYIGANLDIPEGSKMYNSVKELRLMIYALEFRWRLEKTSRYKEIIEKLKKL